MKVVGDPKSGNIPLRLTNPSKEPIIVNKDIMTAVLQPVESVGNENVSIDREQSCPHRLVKTFDKTFYVNPEQNKISWYHRLCGM